MSPTASEETVILQDSPPDGPAHWLKFHKPCDVVRADCLSEVLPALARVEQATDAGCYAAGFVCYEAAPAFDSALSAHGAKALPLLWFGLFDKPEVSESLDAPKTSTTALPWQLQTSSEDYARAIENIRRQIAAGETYQVNHTVRLRAPFKGDAWELFKQLCHAQGGQYGAYVDIGTDALCSASPELFFRLDGENIVSRPMKGTAARGLSAQEDQNRRAWLAHSEKNRAENLMVVDMIRNDLGRIAKWGTVQVPELFAVERYRTVWQMTSTVSAQTSAPLVDLFKALFPCASITGAPKVRTTQLIAQYEKQPRGIYTGSIGFVAPGRCMQFNVAIRTVHVDRCSNLAEYGVGGGIVADSTVSEEYAECLAKSALLTVPPLPEFQLLETIRWTPRQGFFLLELHLERLAASSAFWDFRFEREQILSVLHSAVAACPRAQRVRLVLKPDGAASATCANLETPQRQPWKVRLARDPVDATSRFLYHKTTQRKVYESARCAFPDVDDVLLWNKAGEITESTVANVVFRQDDRWVTPPLSSGLLPGVLRAYLLGAKRIEEKVVRKEHISLYSEILLINSVRGCVSTVFIPS